MEQSPWEANRFSASQEIPPHFMEPKGSLPHSLVPILSQNNPAQGRPPPIPFPEDSS